MPVEVADLREEWWKSITSDQIPKLSHLDLLHYRTFIRSETRRVGVQLSNYKRGTARETFDDSWRTRAWFARQRLLRLQKAIAEEMRVRHRKRGFQLVMGKWNLDNTPGARHVMQYQPPDCPQPHPATQCQVMPDGPGILGAEGTDTFTYPVRCDHCKKRWSVVSVGSKQDFQEKTSGT